MKLEKSFNIFEFLPYFLLTLFLFIAFCCSILIFDIDLNKINFKQLIMKSIFIDTYAQSVSGSTYFYTQQGYTNGGGMPTGYSTYISDGYSFPMSDYHLVAKVDTTNYLYTAIKQIYVNITSYTFSTSNTYIIKINFTRGSYLLHTNNTGWGANVFDNLTFCSHTSSSNNLNTCAISWSNPTSGSSVATIYYSPTVSSNNAIFQIGDTSRANSIIFYNSSSQYVQGIKIDSIDVSLDSSGNGDIIQNQNQNTQIIINNQNENTTQITNSIDDVNDTLTDSSIDNGLGSQFLNLFSHNEHPLSTIVTAPVDFLNSLDDTCTPVSFNISFPGTVTRTVTLPCGDDIFWGRSDLNYVQDFRVFWNILFGGALIYTLGFMLFKTINRALDPFVDDINGLEV